MTKDNHLPIYQGLCLCQWELVREYAAITYETCLPEHEEEVRRDYIRAAIIVALHTIRCSGCPFPQPPLVIRG